VVPAQRVKPGTAAASDLQDATVDDEWMSWNEIMIDRSVHLSK
jgi:hypothetical protein